MKISHRLQGYLLASFVMLLVVYALLFHMTDEARKGCVRLDAVRAVEWRVLSGAERTLYDQARAAETNEQRRIYLGRAAEYEKYLKLLLDASKEFAEVPGRPHIDCTQAYKYPWPFS